MNTLSPQQLENIIQEVQRNHILYTAIYAGVDVLTQNEKDILEKYGFKMQGLSLIENQFRFGMLATAIKEQLNNSYAKNLTYNEFKRFMGQTGGFPLAEKDLQALSYSKTIAYSDIKGLGNKIATQIQNIAIGADMYGFTEIESDYKQREDYEKLIRNGTIKTLALKETVQYLASELGTNSMDWARDFDRIANTTLQNAYQAGRSIEYDRLFGDNDSVKYYKDVYNGACKHCIKLYTESGLGSKPKLFTMQELRANGTNYGKKPNEWKPIVGATHPFCRCELLSINVSLYDFDNGEWIPKENGNMKTQISGSGLVEIEIGNKKIFV